MQPSYFPPPPLDALDDGPSPFSILAPVPFKRVFPPAASGGTEWGSTRGALRFLAADPAAAAPVRTPGRGYSIALDPELTVRGALVGVHFGDPSSSVILSPGDVLDVPGGFDVFYAWNALGFLGTTIQQGAGWVSFLVGTVAGNRPNFSDQITRNPLASIAFKGVVGSSAPTDLTHPVAFSTIGCRALRLTCSALDAGGAYLAEPADFGATLRLHVLTARTSGRASSLAVGADPISPAEVVYGAQGQGLAGAWAASSDNDLAISQGVRVFDLTVPGGALALGLSRPTLAGTGVSGLHVIAEVF